MWKHGPTHHFIVALHDERTHLLVKAEATICKCGEAGLIASKRKTLRFSVLHLASIFHDAFDVSPQIVLDLILAAYTVIIEYRSVSPNIEWLQPFFAVGDKYDRFVKSVRKTHFVIYVWVLGSYFCNYDTSL